MVSCRQFANFCVLPPIGVINKSSRGKIIVAINELINFLCVCRNVSAVVLLCQLASILKLIYAFCIYYNL